jgi:hypothetical protein
MLSVEADQVRLTCELDFEVAVRLAGTVGGWVSVDPLAPARLSANRDMAAKTASLVSWLEGIF